MADSCEKRVEFRKYFRMGSVTVSSIIDSKPDRAPKPRKTRAQIQKELTKKIDAQILGRNGRKRPDCGSCDTLDVVLTGSQIDRRNVKHVWKEMFRITDPKGNVIEGSAQYRASGRVNIKTEFWDYICDKPFGDDDTGFDAKSEEDEFDPKIPADIKYSKQDMKDFWLYLGKKNRKFWTYSKVDENNPIEGDKKKKKTKKNKKQDK